MKITTSWTVRAASSQSGERMSCSCAVCVSDMMVGMGYSREEINDSLTKMKYNDITATYLLLGRKAAEVRGVSHGNNR